MCSIPYLPWFSFRRNWFTFHELVLHNLAELVPKSPYAFQKENLDLKDGQVYFYNGVKRIFETTWFSWAKYKFHKRHEEYVTVFQIYIIPHLIVIWVHYFVQKCRQSKFKESQPLILKLLFNILYISARKCSSDKFKY